MWIATALSADSHRFSVAGLPAHCDKNDDITYEANNSTGLTIDESSFSGLLTRVEIGVLVRQKVRSREFRKCTAELFGDVQRE
jgi:hypothetical protein